MKALSDKSENENALKQYELCLRDSLWTDCKQLACIRDNYDSIDLSGNDIMEIDFDIFSRFNRLKMLSFANNKISFIHNTSKSSNHSIIALNLSHNSIKELDSLDFIACLPKLTYITLIGNPVTKNPEYRGTIISLLPSVRFIDYRRVTAAERNECTKKESNISEEGQKRRIHLLKMLKEANSLQELERIEKELESLS